MTGSWVPPAIIFLAAALVTPFLRGGVKKFFLLAVPVVAFLNVMNMTEGTAFTAPFLGHELVLGSVDRLSLVFGYVFVIMAFAGMLFALHVKGRGEHTAAFFYVGSSLGVVFAGDMLSLFIFWEAMALASAYLIWGRGTRASQFAGLRYLVVHFSGGLLLLFGIVMRYYETGSLAFGYIGLTGLASWLILLGFAVNAAIPPLSAWLSDSYPESTVAGTVFLSAYTSKTAVYVLARAFPGAEVLLWAGTIMTVYGIVYAILENDMRRILAYSIINQVGFMVAGIGIGTELSLNGTVSHAFAHILYKALLMMSGGAVLYMTGKSKCTELGGLYRTMPLTLTFCLVGAASISAFPLTSGFVSKSMVIAAAGEGHMTVIWLLLTLASAGVFLHAGIKFPWFVFFARDSGLRPKEPPVNMLLAMGFLSFLCIFLGVYPEALYRILPYGVHFEPYTGSHVVGQLQILMFSALAFFVMLRYLERTNTISLDTDWFYRRGTDALAWVVRQPMGEVEAVLRRAAFERVPGFLTWFSRNPTAALKIGLDSFLLRFAGPGRRREIRDRIQRERQVYPGDIIRHWPVGMTVLWIALFLLGYLIIYYA
ncbi:MAG: Na(+)/H(+) antiporter subunit D [Nitrospirota bacterium]|jgi:multicomponent Na+:H+ antiporter subunit D